MKCLIYSNPADTSWVKDYFQGVNPYFLKYLNKPLLEYYLDFCVLVGISEVRVTINESGSDLEEYFGNGSQWGVELSYGFAKPEDKLMDILSKNRRYCKGDIFLINGYQFIKYSKHIKGYGFFEGNEKQAIHDNNCSLLYLPGIEDIKQLETNTIATKKDAYLGTKQISSIRSYYDLNMDLISKYRKNYVLPGYNNEDGAYLGKNIIDKKSTEYHKPIVLGNNVQIQMNTKIGPNVILGNNVIIDHSTQITESIIYDHSYIGSELEIDRKIVFKKIIIDPINEELMEIVDSFLVSYIQSNIIENSLQRVIGGIISIFLILITTVPYLLFIFLCAIAGMKIKKKRFYLDHEGNTTMLPVFELKGYNIFKRLFYRFSLDLYPLYYKMLQGKLSLVGNHRIKQNASAVKLLLQLPVYRPGVYDYAGSMLHSQTHENFINDELEYIHTKSILFDLKIMINFYVIRLFSDWHSISDYLES